MEDHEHQVEPEQPEADSEDNIAAVPSGTIRHPEDEKWRRDLAQNQAQAEDITEISAETGKPKRKYRRWTPAMIAKARSMYLHGESVPRIAEVFDVSMDTIHRYTKDLERPAKPPKPTEADRERYWRKEARAAKAKKVSGVPQKQEAQAWQPTTLPIEPGRWDTSGILPDLDLVDLSQRVVQTYLDDVNRGVVFRTKPVTVVQAELVWLHAWEVWNMDWWLRHRESWRATREMGKFSVEDFQEMAGISPASITRYEKNQRTPDNSILPRLHGAYIQAHEKALTNRETILTLRSYLVDHPEEMDENEEPIPPGPEGIDEYLGWLSGGKDIEDFEIGHINHLADVRSLMPYPAWREETSSNLWLRGYAETPEDEGADLSAQGEVA